MIIGIALIVIGIRSLLAEGGWIVGTVSRMILYQKDTARSIDWEQFSGDIYINGTPERGDITLKLRTGEWKNRKEYVANEVYISGVRNVFSIQELCRKRIRENDPTPPMRLS